MTVRMMRVLLVASILAAGCGDDSGDDGGEAAGGEQAGASGEDEANEHEGHDEDGHEHAAAVDGEDRCDEGANTDEFNQTTTLAAEPHVHGEGAQVDFTLREWAEEFVDEDVSGVTADEVADFLEADPRRGAEIMEGQATVTLGPDQWVPTTDPDDCRQLLDEIQQARDVAARYPTLADATAAGYAPGSFYAAGGGAHYVNMSLITSEGFDPSGPELLMFDGHEPDSHLVGVMYVLLSRDGPPDDPGFTGPNDVWHSHPTACVSPSGMTVPRHECNAGRGEIEDRSFAWMAHAWVVPGCESDWGVFSEANPRLPILSGRDPGLQGPSSDTPSEFAAGCNSDKTVDDPLELVGIE